MGALERRTRRAGPKPPLILLYGSQTGTAEGLAKKTAKEAEKRGFAPKLVSMAKYRRGSDEGAERPRHHQHLRRRRAAGQGAGLLGLVQQRRPRRSSTHLHFSVLALGDTNYSAFCQFGKICDERFEHSARNGSHPRVIATWTTRRPARSPGPTASSPPFPPSKGAPPNALPSRSESPQPRLGSSARVVEEEPIPRAAAHESHAQRRRAPARTCGTSRSPSPAPG